jgi:hypothetical protein
VGNCGSGGSLHPNKIRNVDIGKCRLLSTAFSLSHHPRSGPAAGAERIALSYQLSRLAKNVRNQAARRSVIGERNRL